MRLWIATLCVGVFAVVVYLFRLFHWNIISDRFFGVGIGILVFVTVWGIFWLLHSGAKSFYFDPQDFLKYEQGGGRQLPVSATTGTWAPLLPHYIGVTQLIVAVAAASITFGGQHVEKLLLAKIFLAFCILYGVPFCTVALYRYDEYGQDVHCYTRFWYSTVESFGFATVICFVFGYAVWALSLN